MLVALATPMTYVLPQPNEPVRIDMCSLSQPLRADQVALIPVHRDETSTSMGVVTEAVDFTNVGTKAVTDVELVFVERDPFGGSALVRQSVHGSYAPNVRINGTHWKSRTRIVEFAGAYCTVARVGFADGSAWSAGKGFLRGAVALPTAAPSP